MNLSHLGMSKYSVVLDIVLLHLKPFTDTFCSLIIVECANV